LDLTVFKPPFCDMALSLTETWLNDNHFFMSQLAAVCTRTFPSFQGRGCSNLQEIFTLFGPLALMLPLIQSSFLLMEWTFS
jgi:hypothetical protein